MTHDSESEETELQVATRLNNLQKVKDALKRGFNPNELSLYQWAPIHEAVSNGNFQIVKILLQNGADPNIPDALQGSTSLHYAAKYGKLEIVKLLVEKFAANISTRNMNGERAVDVAVKDCKLYLKNKEKQQLDIIAPCPSLDAFQENDNILKKPVQGRRADESGLLERSNESITPSVGSAHSSAEMPGHFTTKPLSGLGNIKLRFHYNVNRYILTIYAEEVTDLVIDQGKMCNLSHIYVKSYLHPDIYHGTKRKTELVKLINLKTKKKRSRIPGKDLSKKMKSAFMKSSSDLLPENSADKVKSVISTSTEDVSRSVINMHFSESLVYKSVNEKNISSRTIQVSVCGKPSSTGAKTRILGSVVIPVAVAIKKSGDNSEWYPLTMHIGPVKTVNQEVECQLNCSWETNGKGSFTGRSLAWSGPNSREFAFTRTLPVASNDTSVIDSEPSEDRAYSGKYSRHCRTTSDRLVCQDVNSEDTRRRGSSLRTMTSQDQVIAVDSGVQESLLKPNTSQSNFSFDNSSSGSKKVEAFVIEAGKGKATRPRRERISTGVVPKFYGGIPSAAPIF